MGTADSCYAVTFLLEPVIRNAYRTLGIPGSATSPTIYEATTGMLRALKLGVPKVTDWDLPWLGPLIRTESSLREAAGRLVDPRTRLYERLFWFHEGGEILKGLSLSSLSSTALGWSSAPRPAAQHDAALLFLLDASISDPNLIQEDLWIRALCEWRKVVLSEDYWNEVLDVETNGQFEITSTLREIDGLRTEVLRIVAQQVKSIAAEAIPENDVKKFKRVLKVLRFAPLPEGLYHEFEHDIVGLLWESIDMTCRDITGDCRSKMIYVSGNEATNLTVCEAAYLSFKQEVQPKLAAVLSILDNDTEVARDIRERVGDCIHSIAIDHWWAGSLRKTAILLAMARRLVPEETVVMNHIQDAEKKIGQLEEHLKWLSTDIIESCRQGLSVPLRNECGMAISRFRMELQPYLEEIIEMTGRDSDLSKWGRELASDCLENLAKNWRRAGDVKQADELLYEAKNWLSDNDSSRPFGERVEATAGEHEDAESDSQARGREASIDTEVTRGAEIRPVVRFGARTFDIYVGHIIFVVLMSSLAPIWIFTISSFWYHVFLMLFLIFLEASVLSTTGTTLGKWLLSTRVLDAQGKPLSFSKAIERSVFVWIYGLGLGIPIVTVITQILAYSTLKTNGVTRWDKKGDFSIAHGKLHPVKVTLLIALLALSLYYLI